MPNHRELGEDITLNFTMSQSMIRQMDLKDPRNDGSIRVDPYAFNQSKVIATERKLFALAETDREMTNVQNGDWLKQKLASAKRNEVIMLKSKTYKFNSLFIGQPITLIGQAGTILEVDGGSIFVDFLKESGDEGLAGEIHKKNQVAHGAIQQKPSQGGTPLTIKKSKVAKI